jgi:H+-translocating NAD(P) transhydrogenase subunit alpha
LGKIMIVGVPCETFPGETRVALIPASIAQLTKMGVEVRVQAGAGQAAGFLDQSYLDKGAQIASSRDEVFAAGVILQVRAAGANPQEGKADLPRLGPGKIVVGLCDPLGQPEVNREFAATGATLFGLELLPRITRAQGMDVLSSQATIAGYRAVILAALELPKIFPMLITAAGTLNAAKVFIVGAGVAGLQALATARRLGAAVSAYDVRPAAKEQIASLGGKVVEMPLDTAASEGQGGYAQAMDEAFYKRQQELMARVVAGSDVVITTAAVPGKKSPVLVTKEAVEGMAPGAVIVDLAAERGGNCELTQAGRRVFHNGVTILGPLNPAAEVPQHASQMYSKNISTFLLNLVKDGQAQINLEDEIIRETLIARDGQIVHAGMQKLP